MKVRVECYAGYKGEERPVKFWLGDSEYDVVSVEDQWYSPEAIFFRVLANDDGTYVLRHDETSGVWTLEAFRARNSPGISDPPSGAAS